MEHLEVARFIGASSRPFRPAPYAKASKLTARQTIWLFGFHRIALGRHDVAKGAQAVALFGAKSQLLRKLIAFVCCDLGRIDVEDEQRGRFDSKQFRFQSAKSACPRDAERCLGDVEGSSGVQGRERRAQQRGGRRGKVWQMDLA